MGQGGQNFICSKKGLLASLINQLCFPDSSVGQLVKNLPAMQELQLEFRVREDPLEKGKATHSSNLGLL